MKSLKSQIQIAQWTPTISYTKEDRRHRVMKIPTTSKTKIFNLVEQALLEKKVDFVSKNLSTMKTSQKIDSLANIKDIRINLYNWIESVNMGEMFPYLFWCDCN